MKPVGERGWYHKIPWWVRWSFYPTLVIVGFYVVEDIRGARAWKQYAADFPELEAVKAVKYRKYFPTPVTAPIPYELSYYGNNRTFQKLNQSRTFDFYGVRRKLEFPLVPFRRCGVWHPVSVIAFNDLTELDPVKLILDDGGVFSEIEIKGDSDGAIYYLRCLIWRSLAYLDSGQIEESRQALAKALKLIDEFDSGVEIRRSNDVAVDIMNALQILWQMLNTHQLSQQDISEFETLLENIDYEQSARQSALSSARSVCEYINQFKSRPGRRLGLFENYIKGPVTDHWREWLETTCYNLYLLLMPNGWLDHNKVHVCRELEFLETRYSVPIFNPLRSFPVHIQPRFDPRPTEAFVRCGLVALAAEKYFLENGVYPQTVEQFGLEMKDPFDPEIGMRFAIENELPVIYSIGPNRADDGGKPRAPIAEGDLVWRYQLPEGFTFQDYILH